MPFSDHIVFNIFLIYKTCKFKWKAKMACFVTNVEGGEVYIGYNTA